MMEYISLNDKKYKFVVGNGRDNQFRMSFNALTEKTFGFHFEQWYQNGYWKNQYIPYSLMDGEIVVANVSVNLMNMEIYGETRCLIQLGTVMTDAAYRNKGLSRIILDKVIAEWQSKCDYIYLFANDSVLNFYPKFGFRRIDQYQCTKVIGKTEKKGIVNKLDMSDEKDKMLLYNKVNASVPFAEISMLGNAELIMFYCTTYMKGDVYYIQEYDAVVVANYGKETLKILGIFCEEEVPLGRFIEYMVKDNIKRVKFDFTPKEGGSYVITPLEEDTLFVLGDTKSLADKQFMFPTLSHA